MKNYKKIVVKIGTKVITTKDRTLDTARMKDLVCQIAGVTQEGADVVLVTSGAIGSGLALLGLKKRPADLASLQATAAIGQNRLMQVYSELFRPFKMHVGQMLLTQEDFNDRARYLNIKHTINKLLEHEAVPIINENDTVATEEIKCGDNDRLSCLVADLWGADLLILLTDVDGLLDGEGNVITEVSEITHEIARLGGKSHCDLGTGGMATKIEAARSAVRAGVDCMIANGAARDVIRRIVRGDAGIGTAFRHGEGKFLARKRWIAFSSRPKGGIRVDAGAKAALTEKDSSLLASGIILLDGQFRRGDVVRIEDELGREIARGVTNYSALDLAKIKGMKTSSFKTILGGGKMPDEVVHKDNLVIT